MAPEVFVGSTGPPRSGRRVRRAFGDWQLLELLGKGGSCEVWRAGDPAGGVAALKILRPEFRYRRGAEQFLRREYTLLTTLAHPHVATALGIVEQRDCVGLALEYLPGGDLVALIGSHPRHWLGAIRGVLRGLKHLHASGYAHGDLKARNVLLAADGSSRLVDFASVQPLQAEARVTTAACAPAGRTRSGREADCVAFAALLYELLTGQLPYGTDGSRGDDERPRPMGVPTDLEATPLMAAAIAALAVDGRLPGGLSAFEDVIESAVATHC